MLEGLVANLLNRFLGMYVKNFDPSQLKVGIFSGEVKLRNLELRREALDQLHLPLNVVEGMLGELTLSIPFSNLRGKPVKVNIEDVFLLAAPKGEDDFDAEEDEKRAVRVKLEKLESAELLKERNPEGASPEEQQKNQSFTQSLVTAIVDNLQVSIKNVHIRYEDSIAVPNHPFAVGFTLKEMSAVSTDSDWVPKFISADSDTTHKLAVLNSLGLYWNSEAELFGTGKGGDVGANAQDVDKKELIRKFREGIENTDNAQYLLKPVSGRAGIELDKTGAIDKPKTKARLLFQELGFIIDEDQYRDALMLVDLMHYFVRHQEYKKKQPQKSPKEDPKAWLKFAGTSVLDKIHDRNRRWSWEYFKERRDQRLRYIELFKKKKKDHQLSPSETKEMDDLEFKVSYEDLRFWRSLARSQLRKENVGVKKPAQKQTWGQWVWGQKPAATETAEADTDAGMSEEDRKQLYDAIDWDEKKALAESVDMPREAVKLQIESSLRTGSFTLKRDPHGKSSEILKLVFDNFQAKALQRTDSLLADLALEGLRVYDGTTPGSLFPQIVKVKGADVRAKDEEVDSSETQDLGEKSEKVTSVEDSFFHLIFENNPLDNSADTSIMLTLKSLEFIHNPKFLEEIVKFFKPPERQMESIGALLETAGATVEEIRQQTRAGLEFALEEHKTINANFDIQAPIIIIPESITEESALCMIVDAGHASLNSELVDQDTMNQIHSKRNQQYTDEDYKRLEGLMYDKFVLKLDSTQVLIGPGIEATRAQLESKGDSRAMHLIDRINMNFLLENSIIPKDPNITKTRVTGSLPLLRASISDKQYKNLMRLIEVAVPKFDDAEPVTSVNGIESSIEARKDDPQTRRKSTALLEQRNLAVIEHDSDSEEAEDDKKEVEKPANLHQRNFEVKFVVEKLQASLFKADQDDSKPDQLLVEMVAERFAFDFYVRPFDMVAEVALGSLAIDDHIEENPLPEFKQIISSKGSEAGQDKDLFSVKFVKVNPESPEFQSTYEGIATNLDVVVSTINIIVTRKTLLTLLDFVLSTFAGGQDGPTQEQQKSTDKAQIEEQDKKTIGNQQADKIRIRAQLSTIALILNNDGVRLATLSLNSGDVGIFLDAGNMQVKARLGSLNLVDDINQGAPKDSSLRRLIAIEGDDLADFKYQTFSADRKDYPGFDSGIYLRSGSIKINFLEEPFRKIMEFGVKFGKMQAIYNAARQAAANQASQVQESAQKLHFDILVKTPILVFPRAMVDERPRDNLTAYLGEIYASNRFVGIQGQKDGPSVNKISAGIRSIQLTSEFHFEDGQSEVAEMIEKVDLDFKVRHLEHQPGLDRPDTEVDGTMSPVNLRVSQTQFKLLMELSKTIPAAFATEADPEADLQQEIPASTLKSAKEVSPELSKDKDNRDVKTTSSQSLEHGTEKDTWTTLSFVFKAPTFGLELILANDNEPTGDLDLASMSKFSLNDTNIKMSMVNDGAMEAELLIHSFTIRDSRAKENNKFRKIMSLINNDVQQQFMASVSISGGTERHMTVMLTIDSPRIIFALDYLFALQAFANTALASGESSSEVKAEDLQYSDDEDNLPNQQQAITNGEESKPSQSSTMTMSFRINIIDAQIILIANPTISNTEAIVLGTKEVLVSQQNATTLQITKVGMFLCRMDKFDSSRLRILDDFTLQLSMESRSQGKDSSLTSIHIDIEPLVLRLSLRDILLAMQIVSKASSITEQQPQMQQDNKAKPLPANKSGSNAPSTVKKSKPPTTIAKKSQRSKSVLKSGQIQSAKQSVVMKREEVVMQIEGVRVILIGDLHELPLLDWSVKKFDVNVRDWSGAMTVDTNMDTFLNVYNFSKSAWEPLIEPWQLGFHMAKQQSPEVLTMELYSHKTMELTITSATIALASKSFDFLSTEEDILSKPRIQDAPYRIKNYTGFDLSVWAEVKDENGAAAKLSDGEEYPWRFEDPTSMRENLSPEGNAGLVGVKLEGSGFDSITRIPVIREGETLYNLKPRKDKVQHRMLVEVRLGSDNVKYITFRSPLLVENKTQIPIEVGVFSPEEGDLLKIEKIPPGEGRPAPIGAAFVHSLLVRPDQGFGYGWSNERLFWKDLLKKSTRAITCRAESNDQSPPFFFQMHAAFDDKDPMTKIYPYMRIQISAPVEVQNLLPYDFKYRIYDKNTKKDWTNFLRKGGVSPVHVVELSHLLLLSVELEDSIFKQSDFAIINSNTQEDFRRERDVHLKSDSGAELRLRLHYTNIKDSGGAFKVSVYSPYLILNRTGSEMGVQPQAFFRTKAASNQGMKMNSSTRKALPYMFSYPTDDRKNRSMIKIGESAWSKPQSFDAIGSTYEVVLPAANGKKEMVAGVSVTEGEGKYNLTKIVVVTPRFVLKNKIGQDIELREPGSSEVMSLKNNDLLPLYFMQQSQQKQLCVCFPGPNNQWSSPFDLSNIGMTHIKVAKHGQRQQLVRVEIILEDATLFLHFSIETKHWPFSMRNESDTEFLFFQANPNLAEDEEEDRGSGWKPIRYKLPPRSIMPYAWDYPASKNKELVITSGGKERYVKLAEIGNLIPFKLPPKDRNGPIKVVDINIVADGPTQSLVLSNYKPSKSLYRQKTAGSMTSTTTSSGFEVKEVESEVSFKAELRLAGFGISLVNTHLKELLYMTFRDIDFKYGDSKLYQTVNATIKWVQIDNQLYGGIFPILLYPSVVPKTGKEMEAHPIFHAMVTRVKDDSYGVLYIKYATLLLQQITIELDEDFIFALLDFTKVPGASWSEEKEGKLCDENLDIPEPKREEQGQDVYFELLHLQPMQLDLSFVRTERVNAEDTLTSSPFMFFVNVMTMSIGNVNDAPIKLNALMLENARIPIPALMTNIQSHYTQEFLRQIHIILGSADFLGNPVGLFNNISSGVADIFYEPYQGLVMTDRPQELGIGIAKGASSFVKKSVFGFSDSMAKFTGSMSKGLAAATLDKEFQDQRRMSKSRNRPKHALYGVTSGGSAFAASLASGIGGLARHPLEGAEKEGAVGLIKGVGKGFLGLATKPAIGAFDLASNVAEGVRNTTTVFDAEGLDRVRLTRFIGMDGIVRPYAQREALGQFWLKTADDGKYFNEEYIAHIELEGKDMLVMVTYDRILMIRSKKLRTEWDVKLTDVQSISKERTGMSIGLKGGSNGPFIPVTEESSRNWLYKQIAIAVNAFNDKYNAKG